MEKGVNLTVVFSIKLSTEKIANVSGRYPFNSIYELPDGHPVHKRIYWDDIVVAKSPPQCLVLSEHGNRNTGVGIYPPHISVPKMNI